MVKVLVTGGSGFIGSTLTIELLSRGHEVYNFELYRPTHGLQTPTPTFYGNITYYHSISRVMEIVQPDVVIHLASMATRGDINYENFDEMLAVNVIGTANVAEAARRILGKRLKMFCFASSSEVYGNQQKFPITEEAETQALCPYTIGKVSAQRYLEYLHKTWDFPAIIIRPFNTFGLMRRRTVVESIVSQMLRGGPVLLGEHDNIRDMVWIDDHVGGYIACLERGQDFLGETFNICTGRGLSIAQMVQIASKFTGYNGDVRYKQFKPRINDIKKLVGSYAKAKRLLGWEPKTSFETGVQRMVEAWRK